MKTKQALGLLLFLLLLLAGYTSPTLFAQGTAITYQGRLNDNGVPANGIYDLIFTLYDSPSGGSALAGSVTNTPTTISNGLFTVTLDFGTNAFPGAARWLGISVRTNNAPTFSLLIPRQKLTASPYAITASYVTAPVPASQLSGTLASGLLAGTYGNAVTFNNPANSFSGNGGGLTNVNAATLDGLAAGQFWKTSGNSNTVPGADFLGTTDFQPLELKAGGMRVLRLEPDARTNVGGLSGNLIGGYISNVIEQPGSGGDFIGGGGYPAGPNVIHTNSQGVFIGAGSANQIGPNVNDGFIGAGYGNAVQAQDGVIVGGTGNAIALGATYSVIGGGYANTNFGSEAFIGGGQGNVNSNAFFGTIGGGENNRLLAGASFAVVAGGYANAGAAASASIGGGSQNSVVGPYSSIQGGLLNSIGLNSWYATIGSGSYDSIGTNSSSTTISGGYANAIKDNTLDAAIGGGSYNTVGTNSNYSAVGGGRFNSISDNASSATVAGGFGNSISGGYAAILGGYQNAASGPYSFAAGTTARANHSGAFVWADASDFSGFSSTAANQFSVRALGGVRLVTGGAGLTLDGARVFAGQFTLDDANHSNIINVVEGSPANYATPGVYGATISGGGASNYNAFYVPNVVTADFGSIGGGEHNTSSGVGSTIAGGVANTASGIGSAIGGGSFENSSGSYAKVGGGFGNSSTADYAVVGGGSANTGSGAYASVAGGSGNMAGATNSTIGGGGNNLVQSNASYSVVAGGMQNSIQAVVYLANLGGYNSTISGGLANTVASPYATIGGGSYSSVGTNSNSGTIGGGFGNSIANNTFDSTIGGGSYDSIGTNAFASTIGGGTGNSIANNATAATVAGGYENSASGAYATALGGANNAASGNYGLAAGRRAKANHNGTFVWADSTDADFSSTGSNQFLIRASGGAAINTNDPAGAALNVAGTVRATAFQGDGSGLLNVSSGTLGNYLFAYATAGQTVAAANTYQDIVFNTAAQISGWSHAGGTAQFTANQPGLYLIQYNAQAATSALSGTNVSVRVTLNSTEVPGSQSAVILSSTSLEVASLSRSFLAAINAADVLSLQFTGSSTASRLVGAGVGSTRPSASLIITRIQ